MTVNFMEIFTKEYVKEYFKRNKNLILISILVLVLSSIFGMLISEYIKQAIMTVLHEMVNNFPQNQGVIKEAVYLFFNNMRVDMLVILFGIFFSVISIAITISNGIIIGFTSTLVNPTAFIVGIFPHGIFELSASVIALTCAFIITKFEIRIIKGLIDKHVKEEFHDNIFMIKDIILSIIIVIILLALAAIIEAGITPILLRMIT